MNVIPNYVTLILLVLSSFNWPQFTDVAYVRGIFVALYESVYWCSCTWCDCKGKFKYYCYHYYYHYISVMLIIKSNHVVDWGLVWRRRAQNRQQKCSFHVATKTQGYNIRDFYLVTYFFCCGNRINYFHGNYTKKTCSMDINIKALETYIFADVWGFLFGLCDLLDES